MEITCPNVYATGFTRIRAHANSKQNLVKLIVEGFTEHKALGGFHFHFSL